MYCQKCGGKLESYANNCAFCGTPVQKYDSNMNYVKEDKKENDEIYSGTINLYGSFTMKSTKISQNSSLQRLIELVESSKPENSTSISGFSARKPRGKYALFSNRCTLPKLCTVVKYGLSSTLSCRSIIYLRPKNRLATGELSSKQ